MEPRESHEKALAATSPRGATARSGTRAPVVHVLNPFVEGHVALGRAFSPVKHQVQLARDLANLPQFLCRRGDIVLVPERPSVEFLAGIRRAGFSLPEFVEIPGMNAQGVAVALASRKLGGLRPWGWGPDMLELLGPVGDNVTGECWNPSERYNPALGELYSKAWSAESLRRWLAGQMGDINGVADEVPEGLRARLCEPEVVGVVVSTVREAMAAVAAIRARGHHRVVLKEAIGLAGRNSLRLWEPDWLEAQRVWLEGALSGGRTVIVEPWLERVLDFSVQLDMGPAGLRLCGFTGLINDRKGQFQGNWASADDARRPPAELGGLFPEVHDAARGVARLFELLAASLEPELSTVGFRGPVGIDAFVYRDGKGMSRLKPLVEINPRYTMGRLTIELMKHVAPGRRGEFRLVNTAALRESGAASFPEFASGLEQRMPLQLEGEHAPKIMGGALCLNDAARASAVLATFRVDGVPGCESLKTRN